MEINPLEESTSDPAPALGRGLQLLDLLVRRPHATLEDLVRATAWPRSSLFRLLASLERNGLAQRDATRRWRACAVLTTIGDGPSIDAWRDAPAALARRGARGELWRFTDDGAVLLATAEPADWAMRSAIQPPWRADPQELLAPVQLWWAHRATRPPGRSWYMHERRRQWLSAAATAQLIDRVRLAPLAECIARNHNALRRTAAVLHGSGQALGALVAVHVCFTARETIPRTVRETLLKLATTCLHPH